MTGAKETCGKADPNRNAAQVLQVYGDVNPAHVRDIARSCVAHRGRDKHNTLENGNGTTQALAGGLQCPNPGFRWLRPGSPDNSQTPVRRLQFHCIPERSQ